MCKPAGFGNGAVGWDRRQMYGRSTISRVARYLGVPDHIFCLAICYEVERHDLCRHPDEAGTVFRSRISCPRPRPCPCPCPCPIASFPRVCCSMGRARVQTIGILARADPSTSIACLVDWAVYCSAVRRRISNIFSRGKGAARASRMETLVVVGPIRGSRRTVPDFTQKAGGDTIMGDSRTVNRRPGQERIFGIRC